MYHIQVFLMSETDFTKTQEVVRFPQSILVPKSIVRLLTESGACTLYENNHPLAIPFPLPLGRNIIHIILDFFDFFVDLFIIKTFDFFGMRVYGVLPSFFIDGIRPRIELLEEPFLIFDFIILIRILKECIVRVGACVARNLTVGILVAVSPSFVGEWVLPSSITVGDSVTTGDVVGAVVGEDVTATGAAVGEAVSITAISVVGENVGLVVGTLVGDDVGGKVVLAAGIATVHVLPKLPDVEPTSAPFR